MTRPRPAQTLCLIALALLATTSLTAALASAQEPGPPPGPESPTGADPTEADATDDIEEDTVGSALELLEDASLEARALYESRVDSVVFVQARGSVGTGFYVADGIVVTSYHVIADGLPVEVVHHDGLSSPVTVLSVDRDADLALLRVASPSPRARPVELAEDVTPGQLVMVVGHPYAAEVDYDDGVTTTWSWSLGRVTASSEAWLQTDAQAYPGNSGGPVFDRAGRVLGVVTLGVGGASSLVFAVRADWIADLLAAEATGYEVALSASFGVAWLWWNPGRDRALEGWAVFARLVADDWWFELGVAGLERPEGLALDAASSTLTELVVGRRLLADGWLGLDVGLTVGVGLSFDDQTPHRFLLPDPACAAPCAVNVVRDEPVERVGLRLPLELVLGQEPLFVGFGGQVDALDGFAPAWSARVGVAF